MASQESLNPREAQERTPLPRQEILEIIRSGLEHQHAVNLECYNLFMRQWWSIYDPQTRTLRNYTDMSTRQAQEFCNKTVPIYLWHSPAIERKLLMVMLYDIYTWLYDKCFIPYRSEVEWGQFIARVVNFRTEGDQKGFSPAPEQGIETIVTAHAMLCEKVEAARHAILDKDPYQYPGLGWPGGIGFFEHDHFIELQEAFQFFTLHPIFRAVIIMVDGHKYDHRMIDIGGLPVRIIRTGIENGLSGPVIFDSIGAHIEDTILDINGQPRAVSTTMDIAIKFVKELENREIAAFGPEPDPFDAANLEPGYLNSSRLMMRDKAYRLGWQSDWGPLEGPSSGWVDTTVPVPERMKSCPSWYEGCCARREWYRKSYEESLAEQEDKEEVRDE